MKTQYEIVLDELSQTLVCPLDGGCPKDCHKGLSETHRVPGETDYLLTCYTCGLTAGKTVVEPKPAPKPEIGI